MPSPSASWTSAWPPRCSDGHDIAITHQQLADELGTVREIVTRLLRRFEREGWVRLAREHIHILDSAALRTVAAALQA